MIIFGHDALESPTFRRIKTIEDIDKTSANEIVFFKNNYALAKYCQTHEITYAVEVCDIIGVVIFANLGAKYLLVKSLKLAKTCQKVANEYFLDAKILQIINSQNALKRAILSGIDGVVFSEVLKKIARNATLNTPKIC